MGKFEMCHIDEQGEIHKVLIKNVDGSLKIGELIVHNWSKLETVFKKVYDLYSYPKF